MTKEWRSRENKRRACGEQDWSQKRAEPSPDDEGWDQPLLTFFLCLVASASSPHAGSLGTSKGRLAGECKSTRAAWPERLQLNSIAGRAFRSFNSTSNKRLSTRICGTKFVSEAVWEITLLSIFSLLLIMLLSKWYGVSVQTKAPSLDIALSWERKVKIAISFTACTESTLKNQQVCQ